MKVEASDILPSQGFLKPATVRHIFSCIRRGALEELPPPIVRRDSDGKLVAIDGHNLIAVRQFRGEALEVYVARSASDGLPATREANIARNQDLKEKFGRVLEMRRRASEYGIDSFADLVGKYNELFNEEARG